MKSRKLFLFAILMIVALTAACSPSDVRQIGAGVAAAGPEIEAAAAAVAAGMEAEAPAVAEPTAEEPAADEPAAEEPAADEPAEESAADEPAAEEPAAPATCAVDMDESTGWSTGVCLDDRGDKMTNGVNGQIASDGTPFSIYINKTMCGAHGYPAATGGTFWPLQEGNTGSFHVPTGEVIELTLPAGLWGLGGASSACDDP